MRKLPSPPRSVCAPSGSLPLLEAALRLLSQAAVCARAARLDCWEYAVEIQYLYQRGLSPNDLRWLVCAGHALHAVETTTPAALAREFLPTANLSFAERTCFVLNPQGEVWLGQLQPAPSALPAESGLSNAVAGPDLPTVPRWDAAGHELWWGLLLVKRYRWPAPNQEYVLATFQDENWTRQIDDPLPSGDGQDARQRLHETIKSLNRGQTRRLIRFRGDGTGEGVCWQPAG